MLHSIIVRFIILYLNLWITVSSGDWPVLQSTNCMHFNVAHKFKGGATDLKVGGQNLCEQSEKKIIRLTPPLLA